MQGKNKCQLFGSFHVLFLQHKLNNTNKAFCLCEIRNNFKTTTNTMLNKCLFQYLFHLFFCLLFCLTKKQQQSQQQQTKNKNKSITPSNVSIIYHIYMCNSHTHEKLNFTLNQTKKSIFKLSIIISHDLINSFNTYRIYTN